MSEDKKQEKQPGDKIPQPEATSETAQEAQEARLTGYQTERRDEMNLSLNGETLTKVEIEALDKES